MSYEQALEWLRGMRSWSNMVPPHPRDTWVARVAEADARAVQQAYWVVRAHAEGLVKEEPR